MGITGLLPILKNVTTSVHLEEFKGKKIAVDGYVWLHKAASCCAQDIALGIETDKFLVYISKMLTMFKHFDITPFIVLDGGRLLAKKDTEDKRKSNREENLKMAKSFLSKGNKSKAYEFFRKCVDITPKIAYQLIQYLKNQNITYIVSPYEADAQLAFLCKEGIVDAVVTEDSDLLIFGCPQTIFKLNHEGCGDLIKLEDIFKNCKELDLKGKNLEYLRRVSILSGCDYLNSIPGLGLKTAAKFLNMYTEFDKAIKAIQLKFIGSIPNDYFENFFKAEQSFLYQLVFDINLEQLVTLNPLPKQLNINELPHIGKLLNPDILFGCITGDLNPNTHESLIDLKSEDKLKVAENSDIKVIKLKKVCNIDKIRTINTINNSSICLEEIETSTKVVVKSPYFD